MIDLCANGGQVTHKLRDEFMKSVLKNSLNVGMHQPAIQFISHLMASVTGSVFLCQIA